MNEHCELREVIIDTFTPTGNVVNDTLRATEYAKNVNMNEDNTKAAVVMATQGTDAAMKFMMSGGVEGQQLSYAEMRARYG